MGTGFPSHQRTSPPTAQCRAIKDPYVLEIQQVAESMGLAPFAPEYLPALCHFRRFVIKPLLIQVTGEVSSQFVSAQATQRERAVKALKVRGVLRLRDLIAKGIAPETMGRLVRDAVVVRPGRGLYQLADAHGDSRHTLAEAAARVPKGIICLTSALQFHELTLQMPSAVWMAIERTTWRPKIDYPPIRFVRFSGDALTNGVERHRIEGVDVSVYGPGKTIVDCFRYRNKIGLDVALEGLREGLRRRRCTPDQLWRYARHARVWSVLRPYVEAMSANA